MSVSCSHRRQLTTDEFLQISYRLKCLSNTWHNLWCFLQITGMGTKQALNLTFSDVKYINLPDDAHKIISRRKILYPDDVFLFQSHSNRVKFRVQPVSHIAFNNAIRSVSRGITNKRVSSKSARSEPYL